MLCKTPPNHIEQYLIRNHHLSDITRFQAEFARTNLVTTFDTVDPLGNGIEIGIWRIALSSYALSLYQVGIVSGFEGTILTLLPELSSPLEEYPRNWKHGYCDEAE